MKLFQFVKWQWNKWKTWQKFFMAGAFIVGVGVGAPEPYDVWLVTIGCVLIYGWAFKWMVWDTFKSSYNQFLKERQGLLDTIKNSDK